MNNNIVEVTIDCGVDELIDYIVSRAYPNAVASEFASLDEGRRQSLAIEIEILRTKLRAKTVEEIRAIYRREKRREERQQRDMDESDERSFEETLEFNRPESCEVNSERWAKKPYWTPEEGAALLIGRSPELVKWESVRPYVHRSMVAEKFAEILDWASRAVECGLLGPYISPGAFLAMAKNEGFDVPADLEKFVRERGGLISDWKSRLSDLETQLAETSAKLSEEKKLADQFALKRELPEDFSNAKERTSAYRLLVGAVYAGWKFDPTRRDNDRIFNEILNDLKEIAEIKIDKGTARNLLKKAADHIDFHPPNSRSGSEN
jgi:hypothetical protein